jgi:hypothetical protein
MSNNITLFSTDCLNFSDNRKIVIVEENSRKFEGVNAKQKPFELYRVDGCLIKEGQRCDFLLLNCSDELVAYLIELKGSDLIHAVRQINTTLSHFLNELRDFKKINGRIVLTKVNSPDLKSSDFIKLTKKIRQLGGTLEYKATVLKESI